MWIRLRRPRSIGRRPHIPRHMVTKLLTFPGFASWASECIESRNSPSSGEPGIRIGIPEHSQTAHNRTINSSTTAWSIDGHRVNISLCKPIFFRTSNMLTAYGRSASTILSQLSSLVPFGISCLTSEMLSSPIGKRIWWDGWYVSWVCFTSASPRWYKFGSIQGGNLSHGGMAKVQYRLEG